MTGEIRVEGDGPVVMVDDSDTDVFLARRCYGASRLRNEFIDFRSGPRFLAHFEAIEEGRAAVPALVLLDINMPEMTGFEVLEELRSKPQFENVPIVAMFTNSDDPYDKRRSSELGANTYFTKPSSVDDFVALFDSLVPA